MSEILLMLVVAVPLALVCVWPVRSWREWVGRLAVWAPLPAILLTIFANDFTIDLPWLLLGSQFGLDTTGRVFLGFTATLWLAAGLFGRSYLANDPARDRFELFFLLTMAGNLGVIVSQDMLSFLMFYTLMSLSAYGLITHNRELASMRAGRTYIVLAVLGEILLFWAVVLAAQQIGTVSFEGLTGKLAVSPLRNVIVGLALCGFGIKLGLMPLHFWLPLAHPAAPTPASAVLSGAIIKTGLLGLLRFLPLGAVAMPEWGALCIVLGIASAFIAVFIGLTQDNPKTVLAYSSISQMGLVTVGIGAALMVPEAWKTIGVAILLFATHHAFAKASLFLGVGVAQAELRSRWRRWLVVAGLVVAALSLAGLPLTSGLAAKAALKYSAATTPEPWLTALKWLLPLTGLTTTLLVSRFLFLVWPSRQQSVHVHHTLTPAMAISWGLLASGVVVLFIAIRFAKFVKPAWVTLAPETIWAATWPMLVAGLALLSLYVLPLLAKTLRRIRIPAGDVVILLDAAMTWCHRTRKTDTLENVLKLDSKPIRRLKSNMTHSPRYVLDRITGGMETDIIAGIFIGLIVVVLFVLMIL